MIEEIKQLAESNGLKFKDLGNGQVQLKSKTNLVSYYPESKKKTAYSSVLNLSIHGASPAEAVALCLQQPEGNEGSEWKEQHTNLANVQNFYSGQIPPWEFPTFIASHSDNLRMEARRKRIEAEEMEANADDQERPQIAPVRITELEQAAKAIQQKHGLAN
jgi:hypothetical protein